MCSCDDSWGLLHRPSVCILLLAIILNVPLHYQAELCCERISAPHYFLSLHSQTPTSGEEERFSLVSKMQMGTESPCSMLRYLFMWVYLYVDFFLPLSRNCCFIETLLYSVHMLLIYTTEIYQAQWTLYIWSCILAFATCRWICFVHWADLSRAVSQSRLSCPPSEGEAVSSLSLLPPLPCCSRCSGWS